MNNELKMMWKATVEAYFQGIILEFGWGDSGKTEETYVRLANVPIKIQNNQFYD